MRKIRHLVVLFLLGSGGFISQQCFSESSASLLVTTDMKTAQLAADLWLTQIDTAKYLEAWKGFSPFFQERMTFEKWQQQIQSARSIFGNLITRKLQSSNFATTMPGAPDGNYAIIQYDTAFEKKKNAIETITLLHGKDNKWGLTGYYIK